MLDANDNLLAIVGLVKVDDHSVDLSTLGDSSYFVVKTLAFEEFLVKLRRCIRAVPDCDR